MASYKFWKTQPVPQFNGVVETDEGPIEVIQRDEVPSEPEMLVKGCEWTTIDLENEAELDEVYNLLAGHYVEDDDAMFRINYSPAFLDWAWKPPGWKKQWHVGIRRSKSRKLVACICGIPFDIKVRNQKLKVAAIDFLCIHSRLRNWRLTPALITEITRRCHLDGVYQAIYTSGTVLPKPVTTCRYYHRALDWLKLHQSGFTPLPPDSSEDAEILKYSLPTGTLVPHLRPIQAADVPPVHNLLCRYLARFDLALVPSQDEVRHWLMHTANSPTEQVVWTYVVQEPETQAITDFVSFYLVESLVLQNPKGKSIKAAYLSYYASEHAFNKDEEGLRERIVMLINDALILAKAEGFDVFNALTVLDNPLFLRELKFGPGDGKLHYYLFNYHTAPIAGGVNTLDRHDESRRGGVAILLM